MLVHFRSIDDAKNNNGNVFLMACPDNRMNIFNKMVSNLSVNIIVFEDSGVVELTGHHGYQCIIDVRLSVKETI